jgi:hypothetical protein
VSYVYTSALAVRGAERRAVEALVVTNHKRPGAAIIGAGLAQIAIWWYLIVLAQRTQWFTVGISVGWVVVVIVHALCALSVVLGVTSFSTSRYRIGILLIRRF